MDKIINIDGREVKLKVNGGTLRKYRRMFGRDPLADITNLKIDEETMSMEVVDFVCNFAYLMASTANPDIIDQDEWLESFDLFPVADIAPVVVDLVSLCLVSNVESKKKAQVIKGQ